MKKILAVIIMLSALIICLVSCDLPFLNGGNDGGDDNAPRGALDISSDSLTLFCDATKLNVKIRFDKFVEAIEAKGVANVSEVESADKADVIYSVVEGVEKTNAMLGYVSVEFKNGKLYVSASDLESMSIAEGIVTDMISGGKLLVDSETNVASYVNKYDIANKTSVSMYTPEAVDALDMLAIVKYDGKKISRFDPSKTAYHIGIGYNESLPTVSAECASGLAEYDIVQPTEENGGICKITVRNGEKAKDYTLSFYTENGVIASAVVNKGGALGVVTFVIDDGTISTAEYMLNKFFPKYKNITASFGIKTKALATLHKAEDENGDLVWEKDADGKYVYDVNQSTVDFWKMILATGQAELLSHSHTHTYWGDNDNGGVFDVTYNDGTTGKSEAFPKGNVTMELLASKQILLDLFGEDSLGFVKPGVGAKLSDYYYALLEASGWYISARGTVGSGNLKGSVNYALQFAEFSNRFNVKAYMIEHYDSDPNNETTKDSTPEQCHAVSIENWTDYIDYAVSGGGWACFCIHDIRPDDHVDPGKTAHYIFESQADELFGYANSLENVWIATYDDAASYYLAWSTAKVEAVLSDDKKIEVTLENAELDSRLDVPLTVKVDVPAMWKYVTMNGKTLEIIESDGERYVLVDLVPGESVTLYRDYDGVAS